MDGANPDEFISKASLKHVKGLGEVPLVTLPALIAALISKHDDIKMHQRRALIIAVIVLPVLQTLLGSLAMFARYMSRSSRKLQYLLHILTVFYHGISLILTYLFFVALLEFKILWFAIFLFPISFIMFIISVHMYVGINVNETGRQITSDEAFENVMNNCFNVASFVIKETTFPSLVFIFIGQLKNPTSTSPYLSLVLSANILTFMFAVFSIMVTSLPVVWIMRRSKLVVGIKKIKILMVILTIIMVMILGGKFLKEVVFLALLPAMMLYVFHQAVILLSEDGDGPEENNLNDEPEMPSLFTGVGKGCVSLVSAICISYGESDRYYSDLRVFVFILVSVITVSLCRLIIKFKRPIRDDRWVIYVLKSITFIFPGFTMLIACGFSLKIGVKILSNL